MVQQRRASHTRAGLIRAAAAEFDRRGYAGASLAQICAATPASMGALTFHFASKATLADAIEAEGSAAARALMDALDPALPPLQAAMSLVLGLCLLLECEPTVRAAARLGRERDTSTPWACAWRPEVRRLLERADARGELRGNADPAVVETLVAQLLVGVEADLRERGTIEHQEQVWRLLQRVISALDD